VPSIICGVLYSVCCLSVARYCVWYVLFMFSYWSRTAAGQNLTAVKTKSNNRNIWIAFIEMLFPFMKKCPNMKPRQRVELHFNDTRQTELGTKKPPWILVLKRNILTDKPPRLANKCQLFQVEGVTWSAQRIPTVVNLCFLDRRLEPRLFLPSCSLITLTRLSGPHSRPTTSNKIL
jgi:hypothetical protein